MTFKHHSRDHQHLARPGTVAIVGASAAAGLIFGVCGFLVVASTFGWSEAPPVAEAAQAAVASTPSDDAGEGDAARDPSCDRQAWPYVTPECRASKMSGESRKVRVITRDGHAPPTFIATPAPIVTPQQPKTARATARAEQGKTPPQVQPAPVQSAPMQPPAVQPDAVQPVVAPAAEQQQAAVRPAVETKSAAETKAEPAYAKASRAEQRRAERRARAAERKAREAADRGKVVVRTIEFADGRKVTITREVGRGGMRQAVAELDRASQRAMERETVEERSARPQYYSVQSDGYFADED